MSTTMKVNSSSDVRELVQARAEVKDQIAELQQEERNICAKVVDQLIRDGAAECFTVNWKQVARRY